MSLYDPEYIAGLFDEYGEREWDRLESDAAQRVSLHIHQGFLDRFVASGDRVLEVGAGPGRFTIELARRGARVTVTDLSPRQLELHAEKTAGIDVEGRGVADITDLHAFEHASFDAVVAFGGPLSYAIDKRDRAADELVRVTRPGGIVLASVMSLAGAFRQFMSAVISLSKQHGTWPMDQLLADGDNVLPEQGAEHRCHLFRASELQAMFEDRGCEILAISASNFVTVQNEAVLDGVEPEIWDLVLRLEDTFAGEPGTLDAGTHIVIAVRRT